jgi:hypothetical protein
MADPTSTSNPTVIPNFTGDAAAFLEFQRNMEAAKNALEAFLATINSQKLPLSEAVKQFYSMVDATADLRKEYGDLEAVGDATAEKISLLSEAVSSAEASLRAYNTKISEQNKALADNEVQLKKVAQIKKRLTELTKQETELLVEIGETNNEADRLRILQEQQEAAIERLELEAELQEYDEQKLKNNKQVIKGTIQQINLTRELALQNLPLLRYEKQREEAVQDTSKYMDSLLSKLTGGAEKSNVFGSAVLAIQKSISGSNDGAKELIKNMGAKLTESLLDPEKALNRVFNIINDKLIQSTLEFDKQLAAVGKNTGGFRKEFEDVAVKMGSVSFVNLSEYGVSLEKYGQAYAGLSRSIGGFNLMLDSQRKLLTDNAASMNTLGISAENYGKLVSKFMASIGKTAEGSRDMINALAKDAIGLGKNVGEYTSQFESAMSRISGYGREAIHIFKELEGLSAATKGVISSQDLLSISDRFKDFDSAAESVSKLNAVLGGTSVNILDMMKADPAEQIMMIKRAASESGLEFDKLNVGYKRLLAEYFSGDMNKAQAFFNANLSEAQSLINKSAASEKELEERKKNNVAFQEKLNTLIDNMKVGLTGVLNMLNPVIGFMTKLMSFPGGPLIATFGMIAASIGLAKLAIDRVVVGIMNKIAVVKQAQAASAEESARTVAGLEAEDVATKTLIIDTEKLAAARRAASAPTPGAPPAGGAPMFTPGMKGTGIMMLGMLGTMALSAGASWAANKEKSEREEKLEEIRSKNKKEELKLEKDLFSSNVQPVQDILKIGNTVYIPAPDDKFFDLSAISAGAFGLGRPGGPVEAISKQISTSSITSAVNNTATVNKEIKSETTNKLSSSNNNKNISSNTEETRTTAPVHLVANLILDTRTLPLVVEAVKEYEATRRS